MVFVFFFKTYHWLPWIGIYSLDVGRVLEAF